MYKKYLKLFFIFLFSFEFLISSFALNEKQSALIKDLSEKIGVPYEKFMFDVGVKSDELASSNNIPCALVPIRNIPEHKECMKAMFGSSGDAEYMRYYLGGKLSTDETVEKRVSYSVERMSGDTPQSLTFIITYGDESVGRIAVGPISFGSASNPEIGYSIKKEYSGKGITKSAVRCILDIMREMTFGKKYQFKKVRATAKPDNKASNAILSGLGFKKSSKMVDDGYGKENEYFYEFG